MKEFKLGGKTIGQDQPIFISAEVGTTCNGDPETAKKLVDAAKEAGMDAVKFQILDPEDKFADKTLTYDFVRHTGEKVTANIYDMLQKYVMTPKEWADIFAYAKKKGIIMFATPDNEAAVDLMEKIGMPAYKIATWDATWTPFARKMAKTGKPVIVDLGASDLEEIARILAPFKEEGNDKLILLHCFHTSNFDEMNLRTVEYLRDTFGYFSGFSAPDRNNAIDFASLAYQPVYIEKRLTLDRKDPNHHHAQALEPQEMKEYVKTVRELQRAIGTYTVQPTEGDKKQRHIHFRSMYAKKPIKAREKFSLANVTMRRPYNKGLDPKFMDAVIGRKATKNLKENDPITWECL